MMSRLIPIAIIVFAIAVVFVYVRPTYSGAITDMKAKIANDDSALEKATQFQQKEAELTQQRSQIPADSLQRLSSFLPDDVNNIQLILDLNALAARSNVVLSNFNVDDSAAAAGSSDTSALAVSGSSPVESLDITLTAVGTYDAFHTFLSGIENSLRPLDIMSLTVKTSDSGIYTYSMSIRLYWLK